MQIRNVLILAAAGVVLGQEPVQNNTASVSPSQTSSLGFIPRGLTTPEPQASSVQGQNTTLNGFSGALKEVSDADAKSAGDYYSSPTATGDGSASVPTDTSEVSASSNDLPPVATGSISRNGLKNGATTIIGSSPVLGSFLAALTAYFL